MNPQVVGQFKLAGNGANASNHGGAYASTKMPIVENQAVLVASAASNGKEKPKIRQSSPESTISLEDDFGEF